MKKWFLPIASAVTAVLLSLAVYDNLPAEMAVHFNAAENPDNWFSKPFGAFFMPLLILFVSWLTLYIIKFEKDARKRSRAEMTVPAIVGALSLTLFAVHAFILSYNLGYAVSVAAFASVTVGGMFILIGNLVPRLPQSSYTWPKIPEQAQRKLARFQGRLMFVLGIGFMLLALLPQAFILPAFIGLLACFLFMTIRQWVRYT